jgi:prepilin-type N-terminal cleavage/methylation domain-containing protein
MKLKNNKAFTLLEVLISIMLLSLVLMALYKSAEILRASNKNLFSHLEKTSDALKGSKVLYMDILQSDGNITIDRDKKFHRLIIGNTQHSLYGLSQATVTWLVYKENNQLLRVEGGAYKLPLKLEENVAIDVISKNMELFKIYKSKKRDKLLIMSKIVGAEVQSFMMQNLKIKLTAKELAGGAITAGDNTKNSKKKNITNNNGSSNRLSF